MAGPVGWIIAGALASINLAGPAYRVTVPACFVIAALRKKLKAEQEARLKAEQEAKQKANKTKNLAILAVFFIKREHQPSNNASNNQPSAIQKIDAKNPNSKNHKQKQ